MSLFRSRRRLGRTTLYHMETAAIQRESRFLVAVLLTHRGTDDQYGEVERDALLRVTDEDFLRHVGSFRGGCGSRTPAVYCGRSRHFRTEGKLLMRNSISTVRSGPEDWSVSSPLAKCKQVSMRRMKALTVCQPYASLIARGKKRVENRTWSTSYRGHLYIHAGKSRKWLSSEMDAPRRELRHPARADPLRRHRGDRRACRLRPY